MPLVGRGRELSKLEAAMTSRSPALIEGAPGLGKTRLLFELQRRLTNTNAVYIRFSQPLHSFLLDLGQRLSINSESGSSVALRGAIWKTLESKPRLILVDDIANAGAAFFRFFERIQVAKDNVIIGSARQLYVTGALQSVFWNPQMRVRLHPLNKLDADTLVASAIKNFLEDCAIAPDFAARVVQAARGNPGRIVDLCIRATDKTYWDHQERIRFGALLMDSVAGSLP